MPLSRVGANHDTASAEREVRAVEQHHSPGSSVWTHQVDPGCSSTEQGARDAIQEDGSRPFRLETHNAAIAQIDNIPGSCASGMVPQAYPAALLHGFTSQFFDVSNPARNLDASPFQQALDGVDGVDLDTAASQAPTDGESTFYSMGPDNAGFTTTYRPAVAMPSLNASNGDKFGSVLSSHLDCLINILRRGGIASQFTRYAARRF